MDLKKIVIKNLFFKVDFDGKFTKKKGKITQEVSYFLIGVLPVLIEYKDGSKERAIINTPLMVEPSPYLRMLHGARCRSVKDVEKAIKQKFKADVNYKKMVGEVVTRAVRAIEYVGKSQVFQDKPITSIMIINID